MPVKLPAPLLGTDEQAGPKSAIDEADDEPPADAEAAIEGDIDGDEDAAGAGELDELQAATPRARLAPATERMMRYRFTVSPCDQLCSLAGQVR
jgi:hypothetical protein